MRAGGVRGTIDTTQMDSGGAARTLAAAVALAMYACSGRAVDVTPHADGGASAASSGAAPGTNSGGVAGMSSSGASGTSSGGIAGMSSSGASGTSSGGSTAGPPCGPTPTQLVDFNTLATALGAEGIGATQLAVDDSSVYFVFGGALVRVPVQGGSFSTLLAFGPQVGQSFDPVATSTAVVFHHVTAGSSNDEDIVSVPKTGGAPTTLALSSGSVLALTANDSKVYFVDQGGLESMPTSGGPVQVLSAAISGVTGLTIAGSNVVVTTSDPAASGAVYAVPIEGGSPTMIAMQQQSASFPMACGSDVCWWTGAPPSAMGPTGPGFIARLSGSNVNTISAPVYPWSLSFDGTDFFETVGCDVCPGSLVRIPSSGAAAVTMATAGFAAVAGACVYFSAALGFDLPSSHDGGIPGSGVYSVSKSYADPMFQRDM